jgi:hypothetical protein
MRCHFAGAIPSFRHYSQRFADGLRGRGYVFRAERLFDSRAALPGIPEAGAISFKRFFIRRGLKIYPAFYVMLLLRLLYNSRPETFPSEAAREIFPVGADGVGFAPCG